MVGKDETRASGVTTRPRTKKLTRRLALEAVPSTAAHALQMMTLPLDFAGSIKTTATLRLQRPHLEIDARAVQHIHDLVQSTHVVNITTKALAFSLLFKHDFEA